jgi:hypothetical protein
MNLTLDEIVTTYPDQLILPITSEQINTTWSKLAKYQELPDYRNMVVNSLSAEIINIWLQEEKPGKLIRRLPSVEISESLWGVVNGYQFSIDDLHIVFIPTEEIDTELFRIPQEWLRIPTWQANYYVAVIVDIDAGWLRIQGYAQANTIDHHANYDANDGCYYLERDWLTEDINIMWIVDQLNPVEIVAVPPLPILTNQQAINLIDNLSQPNQPYIYLPRLWQDFPAWGALLCHDNLLKMLHEKRCNNFSIASQENQLVNLRQWFDHIFPNDWHSIAEIFEITPEQVLWSLRSEIPISRGKILDLGLNLQEEKVALIAFLQAETAETVDLLLLIYPVGNKDILAPGLTLAVFDEEDQLCEATTARENDKLIQLKLEAELGEKFSVHVSLGEVQFIQNFSV